MRNWYFLFVLNLLLFECLAQEESDKKFHIGLTAGITASQVHGDTYWGFHKAGLMAGIFVTHALSETWDAKFEIIYLQKGSRKNMRPEQGDYVFYLLKIDYMEVPLLFKWHHKHFAFEGGLSLGFLINDYEENQFGPVTNLFPMEKTDLSFSYGFYYIINKQFSVNVRNNNSLMAVRKFDTPIYYPNRIQNLFNKGMYNNILITGLHYTF